MLETTDTKGMRMPSRSNAIDFLSMIKANREASMNNAWQQQQDNRINNINSLSTHGVNATNEDIKECYDKACKMETAAGMVSAFDGSTGNFKDVINNFINKYDTPDKNMYHAFYDYIQNGTIDSDELASRTIDIVDGSLSSNDYTYNPLNNIDDNEYDASLGEDETASEEESSIFADLAQVPIDYLGRPTKRAMKQADNVAAWLAKKLGADEEAVEETSQEFKDEIDAYATLPGVNRDDLTYILADFGVDVGLSALIAYAFRNPEYAFLRRGMKWKRLEKALKSYPKITKIIGGAYRGGRDMAIMDALKGEVDGDNILWGMLLGGGGTGVLNTKRGKNISNRFQTGGVMTTTRIKRIIDGIKDTVSEIPTLSDLADFMTKNGITGSQPSIIKKAKSVYKQAMTKVDAILSKIEGTSFSEAARDSVDWLIKKISKKDAPMFGKKEDLKWLKELKEKAGNFTATEKEKIKRFIDSEINLFTNKGEVIEGYDYIVRARNAIQKELEESAKHLGDLGQLNNVVRTAYGIMKGAEEKLSYDGISQGFAKRGLPAIASLPAYQKLKEGDYVGALKEGIYPLIASSRWLKSHIGSMMNRLSGTSRYEFTQWLTNEGRTKLSEGATKEMARLLNGDKGFKEFIKEIGVYLTENLLLKSTEVAKDETNNLLDGIETEEFNPGYGLDK